MDLTFLTLAMLVIGGIGSLWGAVVGAVFIATLNTVLFEAENHFALGFVSVDLPTGSRLVGLAIVMLLVLLFRPEGITAGKEARLGFLGKQGR